VVAVVDPKRVIPRTQLFEDYGKLRKKNQAQRMERAEAVLADPEAFAAMFEESRQAFSRYANAGDAFFPERKKKHKPGEGLKRTPHVILRFEEMGSIVPTDGPDRKRLGPAHRTLRDVTGPELVFEYVEREILVHRTTRPSQWSDGASNRGGLRPDLLGATTKERVPVIGELKTPGDMDAFFALHQGLTGVAHLRTPAQYERMRTHLARGKFPAAKGSPPRFDVYLLFVPPAADAKGKPRYQPRFTEIAEELAYRLLECDGIARSVRRIAALDIGLRGGQLEAQVRYAYEQPKPP
jgi:hypothetical protein